MVSDDLYDRVERVLARHRESSSVSEDFKRLSELVGIRLQTSPESVERSQENSITFSNTGVEASSTKNLKLDSSVLDDESDEEGDLDEFSWMSIVRASETPSSEQHIELARAIESGVLARAALNGEVARPRYATDLDLLTLETQGQAAFQQMILGNLGLVLYWARHSRRVLGYSIQDRFQDGVPGLMRAIVGWDHLRGYEFSTYATWQIRQQITRQQQDHATVIRVPVHVQEDWSNDRRGKVIASDETEKYRRSIFEIWPWELFVELELDEYLREEENCIDIALEEQTMKQAVFRMLGNLTSMDRDIIESRFGINRDRSETLDVIGQRYKVTRERIRQKEKNALLQVEFNFWTSIHWFYESTINAAVARFRQGDGICWFLFSPLNLTNSQLSSYFRVSRTEVIRVREFASKMCALASQNCDPFGDEINLKIWEELIAQRFPMKDSAIAVASWLED